MSEPVECRSESEYAERPTALYWQGERVEIVEILGRWRTPEGVRFLARGEGERVFELFFSYLDNQWQISQP